MRTLEEEMALYEYRSRAFHRQDDMGPNAFAEYLTEDYVNPPGIEDWKRESRERDILDEIQYGGFGEKSIRDRTGNFKAKIVAIRQGWVDRTSSGWETNDVGWKALADAGRPKMQVLDGLDTWHNRPFRYCAFEKEIGGEPVLHLFDKATGYRGALGMEPRLRVKDVIALRDYLSDWINRNT